MLLLPKNAKSFEFVHISFKITSRKYDIMLGGLQLALGCDVAQKFKKRWTQDMGKGNRNRQERAEDKVLNPQKYVQKKKMPAFIGPLVFAVIAVLLIVVMIGNLLVGAGIFMRARTAAESDDFKVNGAMMTYYVNSVYSTYVNYYYEMYSSLMSSSSSSIDVHSLMGIDPNVSLKKQVYNEESGQTWFDYFADMAKQQVEQQLVYCQAARAAGVELSEDDYAAIDASIEQLKAYATMYGYSFENYIAANYGKGVKEKDIRRAMELGQLASKYAQVKNEEFLGASTPEKVQAFFEANMNDYLSADYLSYTFTATKNADAENADTLYAADKDKITAAAEKLLALTTAEEFKQGIKDYFIAGSTDEYREKYYDTYLSEAEGETDEEKAATADQKLQDKLAEDAEAHVANVATEDFAYTVDTDLGAWIFGKDDAAAATANTTYKVVDDAKDVDGTYKITVYFLTRAASRNEDTTRTFTYLLLEESNYTETDAKAALALFENGEKNAEGLKAVAEQYENNSACTTLEEVAPGSTGVDALDEWLFAEGRKAGDYAQITYTYEDTEFYIVVYLDEIAAAEWYIDCRDAQVAEELSDWYDEASKTYVVTVNDKVVNKVKM